MEKRLLTFFLLSAVIFIGWSWLMQKYYPSVPQSPQIRTQTPSVSPTPVPTASIAQTSATPEPVAGPQTQVAARSVELETRYWKGKISNQGAVLTQWTMIRFTDGKVIDPQTGGVNLISEKNSQEFGGTLRFYIPADNYLEKELNTAHWDIRDLPQQKVAIDPAQKQEINFYYNNGNGVEATKRLLFDGSGYDFELTAEVKKGGLPIPIQIVLGPNFGDQSIKPTEYGAYKVPPRVSYAYGGKVSHDRSSSVKSSDPHRIEQSAPITWAGMDDGYFAMVLVPANKAQHIHLFNTRRKENVDGSEVEHNYLSVAVPVASGQVNHLYAGPKNIPTLAAVSKDWGLGEGDGTLVDILDYGLLSILSGILRPITRFMLWALLKIHTFTHNYGWAIVVLTIIINMLFFPLRWKSSATMKKAAALQPKMKELQERMKKLKKDDPQMMQLQKEQLELMKQGNILTGCLPLLLQMPFFTAIYLILTVSIEVRKEPFILWMKDLSSPDPFYLLPVIMCVAMILQTKLTPTPASIDPAQAQAQKLMQYVMPVMLTIFFFIRAPLGLVLYWMMGNIVGVTQQYFINRLTQNVVPVTDDSGKPGNGKSGKSELKRSKKLATEA